MPDPSTALGLWQIKDLRDQRNKIRKLEYEAVLQIASKHLGVELPALVTIEDDDGSLWSINVRATLRLERRGPAELEG